MHQNKSWIYSKKTTNIVLIIIAVLAFLILLGELNFYRSSISFVNNVERTATNLIRPFRQIAQEVANDINAVRQNAPAVIDNVRQTAVNVENAINNVANELQKPETQNTINAILNSILSKINELNAKKELLKGKKVNSVFKQLEDLKNKIENSQSDNQVNEIETIRFDKEFNNIFKNLMNKTSNDKHLKLFAIKHKLNDL